MQWALPLRPPTTRRVEGNRAGRVFGPSRTGRRPPLRAAPSTPPDRPRRPPAGPAQSPTHGADLPRGPRRRPSPVGSPRPSTRPQASRATGGTAAATPKPSSLVRRASRRGSRAAGAESERETSSLRRRTRASPTAGNAVFSDSTTSALGGPSLPAAGVLFLSLLRPETAHRVIALPPRLAVPRASAPLRSAWVGSVLHDGGGNPERVSVDHNQCLGAGAVRR